MLAPPESSQQHMTLPAWPGSGSRRCTAMRAGLNRRHVGRVGCNLDSCVCSPLALHAQGLTLVSTGDMSPSPQLSCRPMAMADCGQGQGRRGDRKLQYWPQSSSSQHMDAALQPPPAQPCYFNDPHENTKLFLAKLQVHMVLTCVQPKSGPHRSSRARQMESHTCELSVSAQRTLTNVPQGVSMPPT